MLHVDAVGVLNIKIKKGKMNENKWNNKTVVELREELRKNGLAISGRKADLIERLQEATKVTSGSDFNNEEGLSDSDDLTSLPDLDGSSDIENAIYPDFVDGSSTLEMSQDDSNKSDTEKEKIFQEYDFLPQLTSPTVYMDYDQDEIKITKSSELNFCEAVDLPPISVPKIRNNLACSSTVSIPGISNPLCVSATAVPVMNTVLVQNPEHGFIMDFTDSTPNDEYNVDSPLDKYVTVKTEPPDEEIQGTGFRIVQVLSGQYATDMMRMEDIKTEKMVDDCCNDNYFVEQAMSHKGDQYLCCSPDTGQDKNEKHENLSSLDVEMNMAENAVKEQSEELEPHSHLNTLNIASMDSSNIENHGCLIKASSQCQSGDVKPASLKELTEACLRKHQVPLQEVKSTSKQTSKKPLSVNQRAQLLYHHLHPELQNKLTLDRMVQQWCTKKKKFTVTNGIDLHGRWLRIKAHARKCHSSLRNYYHKIVEEKQSVDPQHPALVWEQNINRRKNRRNQTKKEVNLTDEMNGIEEVNITEEVNSFESLKTKSDFQGEKEPSLMTDDSEILLRRMIDDPGSCGISEQLNALMNKIQAGDKRKQVSVKKSKQNKKIIDAITVEVKSVLLYCHLPNEEREKVSVVDVYRRFKSGTLNEYQNTWEIIKAVMIRCMCIGISLGDYYNFIVERRKEIPEEHPVFQWWGKEEQNVIIMKSMRANRREIGNLLKNMIKSTEIKEAVDSKSTVSPVKAIKKKYQENINLNLLKPKSLKTKSDFQGEKDSSLITDDSERLLRIMIDDPGSCEISEQLNALMNKIQAGDKKKQVSVKKSKQNKKIIDAITVEVKSVLLYCHLPNEEKEKVSVVDMYRRFKSGTLNEYSNTWEIIKAVMIRCMCIGISLGDYYNFILEQRKEIPEEHPVFQWWGKEERNVIIMKSMRANHREIENLLKNMIKSTEIKEAVDSKSTVSPVRAIKKKYQEDIDGSKLSEQRLMPPNKMYTWLLENFILNKGMRVLYIYPLSPKEVLCPVMVEWATKASKFCINSCLKSGGAAAVMLFVTFNDCMAAKKALTDGLQDATVTIPSKLQRKELLNILPFKLIDGLLDPRSIVLEAPLHKSEEDIHKHFSTALTVSRNVLWAQINWEEEHWYVPACLVNVFLLEYETPADAANIVESDICEIDGEKFEANLLHDFRRKYTQNFWDQMLYTDSKKNTYNEMDNLLLTDQHRLEMANELGQVLDKLEHLLTTLHTMKSKPKKTGRKFIWKHTVVAKDLISKINSDTNMRCREGLLFPEAEDLMTAYTWNKYKERQDKMTLKLMDDEPNKTATASNIYDEDDVFVKKDDKDSLLHDCTENKLDNVMEDPTDIQDLEDGYDPVIIGPQENVETAEKCLLNGEKVALSEANSLKNGSYASDIKNNLEMEVEKLVEERDKEIYQSDDKQESLNLSVPCLLKGREDKVFVTNSPINENNVKNTSNIETKLGKTLKGRDKEHKTEVNSGSISMTVPPLLPIPIINSNKDINSKSAVTGKLSTTNRSPLLPLPVSVVKDEHKTSRAQNCFRSRSPLLNLPVCEVKSEPGSSRKPLLPLPVSLTNLSGTSISLHSYGKGSQTELKSPLLPLPASNKLLPMHSKCIQEVSYPIQLDNCKSSEEGFVATKMLSEEVPTLLSLPISTPPHSPTSKSVTKMPIQPTPLKPEIMPLMSFKSSPSVHSTPPHSPMCKLPSKVPVKHDPVKSLITPLMSVSQPCSSSPTSSFVSPLAKPPSLMTLKFSPISLANIDQSVKKEQTQEEDYLKKENGLENETNKNRVSGLEEKINLNGITRLGKETNRNGINHWDKDQSKVLRDKEGRQLQSRIKKNTSVLEEIQVMAKKLKEAQRRNNPSKKQRRQLKTLLKDYKAMIHKRPNRRETFAENTTNVKQKEENLKCTKFKNLGCQQKANQEEVITVTPNKEKELEDQLQFLREKWNVGSIFIVLHNYYPLVMAKMYLKQYGKVSSVLSCEGDIQVQYSKMESAEFALRNLWNSPYSPKVIYDGIVLKGNKKMDICDKEKKSKIKKKSRQLSTIEKLSFPVSENKRSIHRMKNENSMKHKEKYGQNKKVKEDKHVTEKTLKCRLKETKEVETMLNTSGVICIDDSTDDQVELNIDNNIKVKQFEEKTIKDNSPVEQKDINDSDSMEQENAIINKAKPHVKFTEKVEETGKVLLQKSVASNETHQESSKYKIPEKIVESDKIQMESCYNLYKDNETEKHEIKILTKEQTAAKLKQLTMKLKEAQVKRLQQIKEEATRKMKQKQSNIHAQIVANNERINAADAEFPAAKRKNAENATLSKRQNTESRISLKRTQSNEKCEKPIFPHDNVRQHDRSFKVSVSDNTSYLDKEFDNKNQIRQKQSANINAQILANNEKIKAANAMLAAAKRKNLEKTNVDTASSHVTFSKMQNNESKTSLKISQSDEKCEKPTFPQDNLRQSDRSYKVPISDNVSYLNKKSDDENQGKFNLTQKRKSRWSTDIEHDISEKASSLQRLDVSDAESYGKSCKRMRLSSCPDDESITAATQQRACQGKNNTKESKKPKYQDFDAPDESQLEDLHNWGTLLCNKHQDKGIKPHSLYEGQKVIQTNDIKSKEIPHCEKTDMAEAKSTTDQIATQNTDKHIGETGLVANVLKNFEDMLGTKIEEMKNLDLTTVGATAALKALLDSVKYLESRICNFEGNPQSNLHDKEFSEKSNNLALFNQEAFSSLPNNFVSGELHCVPNPSGGVEAFKQSMPKVVAHSVGTASNNNNNVQLGFFNQTINVPKHGSPVGQCSNAPIYDYQPGIRKFQTVLQSENPHMGNPVIKSMDMINCNNYNHSINFNHGMNSQDVYSQNMGCCLNQTGIVNRQIGFNSNTNINQMFRNNTALPDVVNNIQDPYTFIKFKVEELQLLEKQKKLHQNFY